MANDITLSHVFTLSREEVHELAELVRCLGYYKGQGIATVPPNLPLTPVR